MVILFIDGTFLRAHAYARGFEGRVGGIEFRRGALAYFGLGAFGEVSCWLFVFDSRRRRHFAFRSLLTT